MANEEVMHRSGPQSDREAEATSEALRETLESAAVSPRTALHCGPSVGLVDPL
jgi:hypothetical protein